MFIKSVEDFKAFMEVLKLHDVKGIDVGEIHIVFNRSSKQEDVVDVKQPSLSETFKDVPQVNPGYNVNDLQRLADRRNRNGNR